MDKYKFGNKLTELRTEKKLTQSELGDILGVSNKAVSKWENGSAMPRLDMMSKITEYFGVSIDEFLDIPSDKNQTDESFEQKYLKLYNEKMKRRKILRILLFVVLPAVIVAYLLVYVFAPPLIVKIKYNSLPDCAKQKAVEFENYDTVFTKEEYGSSDLKEISINSGTIVVYIPAELTKSDTLYVSEYEQSYVTPEDNNGNAESDIFSLYYFKDEGLEHSDYFLNYEDNWFIKNYDGMHYRYYDLQWLTYNYDWENSTKLCDWRKAVMSYQILTLNGAGAQMCDKVINYNGKNAKGLIWYTTNNNGNPIYQASLYNDSGESISVQFCDKNENNTYNYETFCKIINSVRFADTDK